MNLLSFLQVVLYLILSHFEISPGGRAKVSCGAWGSGIGVHGVWRGISSSASLSKLAVLRMCPFISPFSISPSPIYKRKLYLLLLLDLPRECCSRAQGHRDPPSLPNKGAAGIFDVLKTKIPAAYFPWFQRGEGENFLFTSKIGNIMFPRRCAIDTSWRVLFLDHLVVVTGENILINTG